MKLIIITPCSRPENLDKIRDSINVECIWIIVYDSDKLTKKFNENWIIEKNIKGGVVGKLQVNHALDMIMYFTFIYVLDDDNLMHPDLCNYLRHNELNCEGLIFGQELPDGQLRIPDKENIKVNHIDQAQYILNTSLIRNKRFIQKYEADGHFIEEIYKEHSDKILVTSEVLSYYNFLKWEK